MSFRFPSVDWTWWGKITAAFLLFVVTGAGLVFVLSPIFDLGWIGKPPSEKVSFYVTGVGVPLLTFAGFLAVLLGFLAQQEQNTQQEEHFQKDRFESVFFQLLRTHNQIVDDIRIEQMRKTTEKSEDLSDLQRQVRRRKYGVIESPDEFTPIQIRGRSAFKHFYEKLDEVFWRTSENKNWDDSDKTNVSKVGNVYEIWFRERESQLNHYFSHLSKLISFVDKSEVADRAFYMELISAQMSAPELKLFFYHVTLMKGKSGHRYLSSTEEILGEYSFFGRLDRRSLIHKLHHRLNKAALGME